MCANIAAIFLVVFLPLGLLLSIALVWWYLKQPDELDDKPPKKKKGAKQEDNKREKITKRIWKNDKYNERYILNQNRN